jgi:hypothetical protein
MANTFAGDVVHLLPPLPKPRAVTNSEGGDRTTLSAEIDRYLATRKAAMEAKAQGAWTAKTEQQHSASLAMFREFIGAETPLRDIGRRYVGDFKMLVGATANDA